MHLEQNSYVRKICFTRAPDVLLETWFLPLSNFQPTRSSLWRPVRLVCEADCSNSAIKFADHHLKLLLRNFTPMSSESILGGFKAFPPYVIGFGIFVRSFNMKSAPRISREPFYLESQNFMCTYWRRQVNVIAVWWWIITMPQFQRHSDIIYSRTRYDVIIYLWS